MSDHADTIRRHSGLFSGRPSEQQLVNPNALWKLMAAHDALLAENQRLRDALERIYGLATSSTGTTGTITEQIGAVVLAAVREENG